MSTRDSDRLEVLQGTLDLLILQILARASLHGHAIAQAIERQSDEVLRIGHGSLYPALQRLLKHGLIAAEDGVSENNRAARFYKLTTKGRKKLSVETSKWNKLSAAIVRILNPAPEQN